MNVLYAHIEKMQAMEEIFEAGNFFIKLKRDECEPREHFLFRANYIITRIKQLDGAAIGSEKLEVMDELIRLSRVKLNIYTLKCTYSESLTKMTLLSP